MLLLQATINEDGKSGKRDKQNEMEKQVLDALLIGNSFILIILK